jgi:hypothetical protein
MYYFNGRLLVETDAFRSSSYDQNQVCESCGQAFVTLTRARNNYALLLFT